VCVMVKSYLFLCLFMVWSAPAPSATLGDPTIFIDSGDPNPLSLAHDLFKVQPDGTTPLTFDFINDTGEIVTQLLFQTTINAGLSTGDAASFTPCSSGYFPFCTVTYDSRTGTLVYDAYTLPTFVGDGGEAPQYGIPVDGAFHITLQGWVTNATSGSGAPLYSGLPTFDNNFQDNFTSAPEPGSLLLVGAALILGACIIKVHRRVAD